jgi:hypothetical protein
MAFIRLTLRQQMVEQTVINTFDFQTSGVPAAVSLSFALVSAFGCIPNGASVYPSDAPFHFMRQMQGVSIEHLEAEARNLYSVTDFYTRPFQGGLAGLYAEGTQGPFVSFGLLTNRVRTDIKRGFKRIAGVPKSADAGEGNVSPTFLGYLNDFAESLSAPLTYDDEGNTITFNSVVLGLEEYTTPNNNRAYKPYPTEVAQSAHVASGLLWSPYDTLRSQVTRQRGRGR